MDMLEFDDIFPTELLAVEARRRRYRIEQAFGFAIKPKEVPATQYERASTSRSIDPGDLKKRQQAVEAAREKAQPAKRAAAVGGEARSDDGDPAAAYYAEAKGWMEEAKAHRESAHDREEAEAIVQAAALALTDAAAMASRERPMAETGETGAVPAGMEKIQSAFGLILRRETEAANTLETLRLADNALAKAGDAEKEPPAKQSMVKAVKQHAEAMLALAAAEQELFRLGSEELTEPDRRKVCEQAAHALELEVQKATQRLDSPGLPKPDRSPLDGKQKGLAQDLAGLSLSGGGIRAATFALGILQGLAQLRLLGMFDYLSTVSGGGYMGSWLSAWISREGSLANVERQLSPSRVSQAQAERFETQSAAPLPHEPCNAEPEPVHHLRAYSRYLAPQWGLFLPDMWTLIAIYLRNLFVNSLFLLPLTMGIVFLWQGLPFGLDYAWQPDTDIGPTGAGGAMIGIFLAAYLIASARATFEEENLLDAQRPEVRQRRAEAYKGTHFTLLLPILLMGILAGWILPMAGWDYGLWALSLAMAALVAMIAVIVWRAIRRMPFNPSGYLSRVIRAAAFLLLLWTFVEFVAGPLSAIASGEGDNETWMGLELCADEARHLLHALGVPLVFGSVVLAGFIEVALANRWLSEYEREWRSRVSAHLMLGAMAWLALSFSIDFLPWLGIGLAHSAQEWGSTGIKSALTALWGVVSAGGVLAARQGGASRPTWTGWGLRLLIAVAPPVFLVGLLALVSGTTSWILDLSSPLGLSYGMRACVYALLAAGVGLLFGSLASVNRFSLHMLYANRLTRCYLGASRPKQHGSRGTPAGVRPGPPVQAVGEPVRQNNRFTGFDPLDDLPLTALRPIGTQATYPGPLLLVNCALNCLAGDELAHQDRRADAFVLTPLHCGGQLTGYAGTPPFKPGSGGLTLGRAMTISGAAVDPNMRGLSTTLTALMAIINARLGWWMENPNPARRPWFRGTTGEWSAAEPGAGLPLLDELLGLTSEKNPYVHLSDGGHFENLGVYELIRRRCRFIVVVDAGTDRVAASDNMGAMLGLVRTDFGVRIDLDTNALQMQEPKQHSAWHCCVGQIRYDEVDQQAVPGLLVYIQATLTGDEPADLLQYSSRHSAFPRQSTLNQFFDEMQFEAYRLLGHHSALQVFGDAAALWTGQPLNASQHREQARAVFARLRERWFTPTPATTTEWLAASGATLEFEQHEARDARLVDFGFFLYPEVQQFTTPDDCVRDLQEFRAVSQMLQAMEQAWSGLRLGDFHAHPQNRGWMNTFRRWTASPLFHAYWPILRSEYQRSFVRFCEEVLNLAPVAMVLHRADNRTAFVAEFACFDGDFAQEWGDFLVQAGLPNRLFPPRHYLTNLRSSAVLSYRAEEMCWLINQRAGDQELKCGAACVAQTERLAYLGASPSDDEAEFFFWMKGPYRSLTLGRQAGREIIRRIQSEAAFRLAAPQGKLLRRLKAFYPIRGTTTGSRLEVERWMDFFFDLGFRRLREQPHGPGRDFVVLSRELN